MGLLKWVGAAIGGFSLGPLGAILGYALGRAFDGSSEDVKGFTSGSEQRTAQANDFEVSLLVLSAIVIKSDGKVQQSELDFVRQHFIRMYGQERANHAFRLFREIIQNNDISMRQVCMQVQKYMDHPSRLQLIHYLFGIAKADGAVSEAEVECIRKIAGYLYVGQKDFESIQAMFYDNTASSYKILEIEKNATDNEIKKAYRAMAKKYHPDKLQHLGAEHRAAAEEKFRKVQDAYERIKKERGI